MTNYKLNEKFVFYFLKWGLGIGDWGLGIGPNPQSQSPIPNPQSPISNIYFLKNNNKENQISLFV